MTETSCSSSQENSIQPQEHQDYSGWGNSGNPDYARIPRYQTNSPTPAGIVPPSEISLGAVRVPNPHDGTTSNSNTEGIL